MDLAHAPAWAAGVIAAAITPATQLVAFVAAPAAGKSTVAELLIDRVPRAVVISADAIRGELGDEADQSLTPRAFAIAYERLPRAIASGQTVIWDATSYERWTRLKLLAAVRRPGLETLAVRLRVPRAVLLDRNRQRARRVPRSALVRIDQSLVAVTTEQLSREGFTWALELAL